MNGWIDISQPLTPTIAHWPGDIPFSYQLTYTKQQTGSVNIGQITTSLHIGTHVDAPFHFDSQGKTIDELDINVFVGRAKVIDVSHVATITDNTLRAFSWDRVTRILLRTSLPNQPEFFPKNMPILDKSIVPFFTEKGIKLLGVDMPSVDPIDSKTLDTHHALHTSGIHILENIMLDHVDSGNYELVALPLAIEGADGSPVRAIIRKIHPEEDKHEPSR